MDNKTLLKSIQKDLLKISELVESIETEDRDIGDISDYIYRIYLDYKGLEQTEAEDTTQQAINNIQDTFLRQ